MQRGRVRIQSIRARGTITGVVTLVCAEGDVRGTVAGAVALAYAEKPCLVHDK